MLRIEALFALRMLDKQSYLLIVTLRGSWLTLIARLLLLFFGCGHIRIRGVGKNGNKADVLKEIDALIYLDDNINQLHQAAHVKHCFLFKRNPQRNQKSKIQEADWKTFCEEFYRIRKQLVGR